MTQVNSTSASRVLVGISLLTYSGPTVLISGSSTITATTSIQKAKIPLYTILTPPADCLSAPLTSISSGGTILYKRHASDLSNQLTGLCFPTLFSLQQDPATSIEYSPGVCPLSYHAATIGIDPTSADTTTSYCCLSGMSFSYGSGCYSLVTSTTTIIKSSSASTVTSSFTAWDWPIQVAWASTDLTSFTPAYAPLPGSVSSSVLKDASSTTRSNAPSDMPNASHPQTGPSAGGIAGVVVGALVGVCILLALVFVLLRRRREQLKQGTNPPAYAAQSSETAKEYASTRAELQSHSIPPELGGEQNRAELQSHWTPSELAGMQTHGSEQL